MAIKNFPDKTAYDAAVKPTIESQVAMIENTKEVKYDGVNVILIQSANMTVTFDKPIAWTRDGEDGGAHQVVHLVNHPSAIQIIV